MPAPDAVRFWVLAGDTPSGPHAIDDVRTRLEAGKLTPATKACRVGDAGWRPLAEFPELAADAPPPPADPPPEPVPEVSTSPPAPPVPPAAHPAAVVVGVVVLAVAGYAAYEWLRPPTPREVAEKFCDAGTAVEAKRYAAARLHPALDAMFAVAGPPRDDDEGAVTRDEPAPAAVGGHYAWARGSTFDPDLGRRVAYEFRLHLVKANGWQVSDLEVLSYDGQRLDPPTSLAREYRRVFPDAKSSGPQAGQARTNDRAAAAGGLAALYATVKAGGAKAVGVAVLAVLGGLWAWMRRSGRSGG